MRTRIILIALCASCLQTFAQGPYVNAFHAFRGPQAYKDVESGITFYVESDGRHIAAISSTGTVLWARDPFVDAHLEPYRTEKPQIVVIGAPLEWMTRPYSGKFILVGFNSSQTGIMDMKTGEFHFVGQD
jgi:hypothetical protein